MLQMYLNSQCNQLPEKQYHYSSLLSAVVAVDSGAGRSGRAVVLVVVAVFVVAVLRIGVADHLKIDWYSRLRLQ